MGAFEDYAKLLVMHRLPSHEVWDIEDEFGWTIAHEAAYRQLLPIRSFRHWTMTDGLDRPVAFIAAEHCYDIPIESPCWDVYSEVYDETAAHVGARYGTLPRDFYNWGMADSTGWTVAHEAAKYGNLPEHFKNWNLTNKSHITVKGVYDIYQLAIRQRENFHEMRSWIGNLELTLDEDLIPWEISNTIGWSLAHEYALLRGLPKDKNTWTYMTVHGLIVAHVAVQQNRLPKDFNQWELGNYNKWSVAHEAASQNTLPSTFYKYNIADENGWTVAHELCQWGPMPNNFDNWELKNKDGWTVAHHAAQYGILPNNILQQTQSLCDYRGATVMEIYEKQLLGHYRNEENIKRY